MLPILTVVCVPVVRYFVLYRIVREVRSTGSQIHLLKRKILTFLHWGRRYRYETQGKRQQNIGGTHVRGKSPGKELYYFLMVDRLAESSTWSGISAFIYSDPTPDIFPTPLP